MFKAVLIEKDDAGYRASVQTLDDDALPEGNVSVRVSHSTLNYKDALAITGQGPVVRKFPWCPALIWSAWWRLASTRIISRVMRCC